MPQLIATIATQRSGTKAIGEALHGGGHVWDYGEVLSPTGGEAPPALAASIHRAIAKRQSLSFLRPQLFEILDEAVAELTSGCTRTIAHVDLMYNQLAFLGTLWQPVWSAEWSLVLDYILQRGVPVIHLVRDVEASLQSEVALAWTGVTHTLSDGTERRVSPYSPWGERDDAEALSAWAKRRAAQILAWRRIVRRSLRYAPHVTIRYENAFVEGRLAQATRDALAGLLRFAEPTLQSLPASELVGTPGRQKSLAPLADGVPIVTVDRRAARRAWR